MNVPGSRCADWWFEVLNGMDELMVRDRTPGVGGIGCGNAPNFGQFHMGGSTVENEVGLPPWDGGRSRVVEVCNHDMNG